MCDYVDNNATFEVLRNAVSEARRAEGRDRRYIHWVGDNRKLAYSRDHRGRLELFVSGEQLETRVDVVARRMELDSWRDEPGDGIYTPTPTFKRQSNKLFCSRERLLSVYLNTPP